MLRILSHLSDAIDPQVVVSITNCNPYLLYPLSARITDFWEGFLLVSIDYFCEYCSYYRPKKWGAEEWLTNGDHYELLSQNWLSSSQTKRSQTSHCFLLIFVDCCCRYFSSSTTKCGPERPLGKKWSLKVVIAVVPRWTQTRTVSCLSSLIIFADIICLVQQNEGPKTAWQTVNIMSCNRKLSAADPKPGELIPGMVSCAFFLRIF